MGEFPAERAPCAPWTRFRCTRVHARTYSDIQMMVHKVHNAPPGAGVGGVKSLELCRAHRPPRRRGIVAEFLETFLYDGNSRSCR